MTSNIVVSLPKNNSLLTLRLLQEGSRKSLRFLHKKSGELSSNCHLCTLTIT
ncbi:TPA: hypothetical protein HH785_001020 [Escherichia coli]|nr:hypothetical protein [Escherichia coli]HAH4958591.1 hypothetical protein [Escherichia coli]HAH5484102.1 hypothetical protein [Escherichia coli]HAH5580722.1 hypothetical protein [Escherichia coli]